MTRAILIFARLALAASFLSAVADRFGMWGPPGAEGVVGGDWEAFEAYTAVLAFYLPGALVPLAAGVATAAEIILAIWLIVGVRLRLAALGSAALLLLFAVSMFGSLGLKPVLDFSVASAAAGLLLADVKTPSEEVS